jgi:hypothetical protein
MVDSFGVIGTSSIVSVAIGLVRRPAEYLLEVARYTVYEAVAVRLLY